MDEDGDLVSCPVCSLFCPQSEIEGHVALHFEDDASAAAAPVRQQQRHQALNIDEDDNDDDADEQNVYCSFGCGALLALHELDSHEEAHRSVRTAAVSCICLNSARQYHVAARHIQRFSQASDGIE
jgi:hypothetical protein